MIPSVGYHSVVSPSVASNPRNLPEKTGVQPLHLDRACSSFFGLMIKGESFVDAEFPILKGIDHIELYVGNAVQAAEYYRSMFGFKIVAHSGLTTGRWDQTAYVLEQNDIRLVVASALSPDSPIARHSSLHGDSVKSVAFAVSDVESTVNAVRERGATVVAPLTTWKDEYGELRFASIKAYGDVIHTFIDRSDYHGSFAPHYHACDNPQESEIGLTRIDHLVASVDRGALDSWSRFYEGLFGFSQTASYPGDCYGTGDTSAACRVMQSPDGVITLPLNEPVVGRFKSQVDEFLEFHNGPGVQHIAFSTNDLLSVVRELRARCVEFLPIASDYYSELAGRIGDIGVDFDAIRDSGILVDCDEDGHLLQVFTRPVSGRPTMFLEIIQRVGSSGFGVGNCRAMFKSIEREQHHRGTL